MAIPAVTSGLIQAVKVGTRVESIWISNHGQLSNDPTPGAAPFAYSVCVIESETSPYRSSNLNYVVGL